MLGQESKWAAAEYLLRQAVEADPEFASANLLLAWAIENQTVDPLLIGSAAAHRPKFMPFAQRALELAGTTSDREAQFIRASYLHLKGDYQRAIPVYEALLKQYPDHAWAAGNLRVAYSRTGQADKLNNLKIQLLTLRPNDPGSHMGAASACLCLSDRDLRKIPGYLDRAVELARTRPSQERDVVEFGRVTRNAMLAWVQGDVVRCRALLEQAENMPQPTGGSVLIPQGYMALGMLQHAEELIQRISRRPTRDMCSVWRAVLAGDKATVTRLASEWEPSFPIENTALALLRVGEGRTAKRMIEKFTSADPIYGPDVGRALAGELAFYEGRLDAAIELLTPVVEVNGTSFLAAARLGAQTLAKALIAKGQHERAIAILERVSLHPGCGYFETAMVWPQVRVQLMQIHLNQGGRVEAEAIRKELQSYLRFADSSSLLRAAIDHVQVTPAK